MARSKQKKRAAGPAREKRDAAAVSQTAAVEQRPADNSRPAADQSPGPKWPLWLVKKSTQQDMVGSPQEAAPEHASLGIAKASPTELTDGDKPIVEPNSPKIAEELASPPGDECQNAHPVFSGVVNLATDMKKENQMQTAKQITPAPQAETAEKIDLRDRLPAKDTMSEKALKGIPDGMASLFGPVIEDEVKGVRSQIREMIQSELQGELGQRFSRNLRIVIRREIAAAVDDQFDRV